MWLLFGRNILRPFKLSVIVKTQAHTVIRVFIHGVTLQNDLKCININKTKGKKVQFHKIIVKYI